MLLNFLHRYYGLNRNSKLDDYLSDVAFFNGKCYACSLCGKEFDCPTNVIEISSKVIADNELDNYIKSTIPSYRQTNRNRRREDEKIVTQVLIFHLRSFDHLAMK